MNTQPNDDRNDTKWNPKQIEAHELIWGPVLSEETTRRPKSQLHPQTPCPPGDAYERFWELQETS